MPSSPKRTPMRTPSSPRNGRPTAASRFALHPSFTLVSVVTTAPLEARLTGAPGPTPCPKPMPASAEKCSGGKVSGRSTNGSSALALRGAARPNRPTRSPTMRRLVPSEMKRVAIDPLLDPDLNASAESEDAAVLVQLGEQKLGLEVDRVRDLVAEAHPERESGEDAAAAREIGELEAGHRTEPEARCRLDPDVERQAHREGRVSARRGDDGHVGPRVEPDPVAQVERERHAEEEARARAVGERKDHAGLEPHLGDGTTHDRAANADLGVRDRVGAFVEGLAIEEPPVSVGVRAPIKFVVEADAGANAELDSRGQTHGHLGVDAGARR